MAPPAAHRSLRDGNGRVARLARWLSSEPCAGADLLRLETRNDGEWECVQAWPRDAVGQHLAADIDALMCELANELGAYVVGRVAWFQSETATYWTSHALRVQPEDLGAMAQAFSGDATSQAIQLQRHQETVFSLNMQTAVRHHATLERMNELQHVQLERLSLENAKLREELWASQRRVVELETDAARAIAMAEDALSQAERVQKDAEEEKSDESPMIKMVQQLLMSQMMNSSAITKTQS